MNWTSFKKELKAAWTQFLEVNQILRYRIALVVLIVVLIANVAWT